MRDGGSGAEVAGRAFQSSVEMMLTHQCGVELKQVISSLDAGYTGGEKEIEPLWYRDVFSIDEEGRTILKIPGHLHHILLGPRAKAFMARPAAERFSAEDENSNIICTDCGASMTITGSLANTTDVVEKAVIVDMAENGATMKATHTCMKTYFIKNRTGEVITITVPALYVRNIYQDLLTRSVKGCNRAEIRVILD